MLLRNFVDNSQFLHILNKKKIKPHKSKPRKAFVAKNRYVRYRDGGAQEDYEVEKKLSEIEGAAAPAIKKIIASARKKIFPNSLLCIKMLGSTFSLRPYSELPNTPPGY